MFNVCPACGIYSEEKEVRPAEGQRAYAVCPECGSAHPFLRLPLFIVSGASGTGKSTLALEMIAQQQAGVPGPDCVHLEGDILWRMEFNRPENDYRDFRNLWLRMAKNISQAGRPVVLYGSAVPSQYEACPERRYFSQVHTLALVCEPQVLAERLRARPNWRSSGSEDFISAMQSFNNWFLENAAQQDPPITLFDTTHASLSETAAAIRAWVAARLQGL